MKLVPRDGYWHVRYKTTKGWQRLATGCPLSVSQEEALKVAEVKVREALSGTSPTRERAVGTVMNVAEALERCYLTRWQGTASDVQLKYVVRALEREIGHWLLADMPGPEGYNKLKSYRDGLVKDGKSKATANRRLSLVKTALREALKEGHLTAMPVFPETLAEENVTERHLSEEEEQRALDWLNAKAAAEAIDPDGGRMEGQTGFGASKYQWAYMRDLVVCLLDTGARLSEMLKLRETDGHEVIFKGAVSAAEENAQSGEAPKKMGLRELKRMKKNTKSGKSRRVPLTPRASVAVVRLLAHPLHGMKEIDADWAGHRWMQVRLAVGLEDVNLHILRHTFACRLLHNGVDLYVVSKLMGHSSIKVTERYAHHARRSAIFEQAISSLSRAPIAVGGTSYPQPFHKRNVS
jgi:integrase